MISLEHSFIVFDVMFEQPMDNTGLLCLEDLGISRLHYKRNLGLSELLRIVLTITGMNYGCQVFR